MNDMNAVREAEEQIRRNNLDRDAFRGCLVGGAIGDALGYPVEFLKLRQIKAQYGPDGITAYKRNRKGLALISDDTQMTLFTATGLLMWMTRGMTRGIAGNPWYYVGRSYSVWYDMQRGKKHFPEKEYTFSWLCDVPEMGASRAPGVTCMNALGSGRSGSVEEPINHSKGCGGIMRVAPVGLYLNRKEIWHIGIDNMDMLAAEIAALTHGHELGYMPAAALAHIVNRVTYADMGVREAVVDCMDRMGRIFKGKKHLGEMLTLMQKALACGENDKTDEENIRSLGQGWVAEETLAIAIYCAVKYERDFSKAVIAAVNHDGDTDSTGAVTGNIVGAVVGYDAIPARWKEGLECLDVILEVADDLCQDCQMDELGLYYDPVWERKYIENRRYYPEQA